MVHRHLESIKNINEDHPWRTSKDRNKNLLSEILENYVTHDQNNTMDYVY